MAIFEKSYDSIKSLLEQWNELRKAHPTETDLSKYGYEGIEASDFDQMFSEWEKILEDFTKNESYESNPAIYATDKRLEKILNQIKELIGSSKSSGFVELLKDESPFSHCVSDAFVLISSIAELRINLHKDLIQSTRGKASKDLILLRSLATELKKKQTKDLLAKAQQIDSAITKATNAITNADALQTEASTLQKVLKDYNESLTASKTDVDTNVQQIHAATQASAETLNQISGKKKQLEDDIAKSNESVKSANEKVSKALEDISRHGLAGSFATQADKIRRERLWWLLAFAFSILSLIGIAICTVYGVFIHKLIINYMAARNLVPFSIETSPQIPSSVPRIGNPDWWKDFLHELPFAAPLIWFGWFSARQIGTLSKIQQDYNYKASTAVAFEGYKKEVEVVKDEALSKQLLETAIRNFGENPIRLYGGADDHGMPLEALVAKIFNEKTFDKWLPQFQKICETFGKCFGRNPT